MVKWIRSNYPKLDIIAGNVCTSDGALRLVNAGANIIKVGVGAGSICTTRVISGCGVPQLTAIMDIAEALESYKIPIVADGGIRGSNDIVKALAAGARAVMLGNLLSGTEETPGEIVTINKKLYKSYRGMAFKSANETRRNLDVENFAFNPTPEGVESLVEYKGSCRKIIEKLIGGLRSGMSYAGAYNIEELQENAEFIQITNSGIKESNYHDLDIIQ
jgi:IMP dehydrogenase